MTQEIHFDHVERRIYPRTFLNTVFVVFDYNASDEPKDLILRIQSFIKDSFNLHVELTEKEYSDGFSIESKDAGHSYYFSRGSFGVKYMKDDYVSFTETMFPFIFRLLDFVRVVLSISMIDKVKIRKVNTLSILEQGDVHDIKKKLVRDILSNDLIALAKPTSEYLGLEDVKECTGTTNGDDFEIHFGFQRRDGSDGFRYVGLVLDESVSRKHVSLDTASDDLKEINEMIFNMFHWSITSNVVSLMNQQL